ncbi:MAG: S41 family peptidase [Planctomycetota bacterium]
MGWFRHPLLESLMNILRPTILLACLLALAPAALPQSERSLTAHRVREALQACGDASAARIWKLSDGLVALGKRAVPHIRDAVPGASTPGKICALRALIELDHPTYAAERLAELAADGKVDVKYRELAVELVGLSEDPDAAERLAALLDELNPRIRLATARMLYLVGLPALKVRARATLSALLRSSDPELRASGAIALAQIGDSTTPGVLATLAELEREPGLRGQLARALKEKLNAQRALASREAREDESAARSSTWKHLDEIRRKLRRLYLDADKITDDKLRSAAAHGLLNLEGDPHSAFMDPDEHRQWRETLDPSYGGIGALIDTNVKDDFRIARPFFGGPAWKADIRTGDSIVSVNGVPIQGMGQQEIIKQIKGPPGTTVVLSIFRDGWSQPKDVTVIRAKIVLPTVYNRMLPGRLGYMEIASFGEDTGRQFREQLRALEAEGMKGLVIDLRWNPGGALRTVKECLTPFLPPRSLVCTVRGRTVGSEKHYTGKPDRKRSYPISVLINGRSASGAELMSGVLRHYSRSSQLAAAEESERVTDVLVLGEPSFGKGTVQYKVSLTSWPGEAFTDERRRNGYWDEGEEYEDGNGNGRWDPGERFVDDARQNGRWDDAEPWVDTNGNGRCDEGERFTDENSDGAWNPAEPFVDANRNGVFDFGAAVRLTVARYYLPSGKNFVRRRVEHDGKILYEGGVEPDIEVRQPRMRDSHLAEFREIQQGGALGRYVDEHWAEHEQTFHELALADRRDPSRYPDFDALYEQLGTRLTRQELRHALRIEIRRRVSNVIGREISRDASDDAVLRRGVIEVLRRLGVDPATIDEYRFFAELEE